MSKENPFEKQVSYSYPTTEAERRKAKPLPTQTKEKDVEKWAGDSNAYLKEHDVPKRVVDVERGQEIYNSTWHNFLIIFFIFILIGGITFGCWGIYNDKFKTVFYDNSTVICEAPTIPECPQAPACPACPSLSCGTNNITVQIPDNLQLTIENNYTGGNESD